MLSEEVVQQFGQTCPSKGDPLFGYIARRLFVRVGESKRSIARTDWPFVHGGLCDPEAFLHPFLWIRDLNLCLVRLVEIVRSAVLDAIVFRNAMICVSALGVFGCLRALLSRENGRSTKCQ
jgi:hypothetical protein